MAAILFPFKKRPETGVFRVSKTIPYQYKGNVKEHRKKHIVDVSRPYQTKRTSAKTACRNSANRLLYMIAEKGIILL
jgi:hypothetical protein